MAGNTGHGHVTPRPDGVKARCGGPGICTVCLREQRLKENGMKQPSWEIVNDLSRFIIVELSEPATPEERKQIAERMALALSRDVEPPPAIRSESVSWMQAMFFDDFGLKVSRSSCREMLIAALGAASTKPANTGCPQCGAKPYATERGQCEDCGEYADGSDGGYK